MTILNIKNKSSILIKNNLLPFAEKGGIYYYRSLACLK